MRARENGFRILPVVAVFLLAAVPGPTDAQVTRPTATPASGAPMAAPFKGLQDAKLAASAQASRLREQARARLRTSEQAEVRRLNQAARVRIGSISAVPRSGTLPKPISSQMRAVRRAPPEPDPNNGTISSIAPAPASINQLVTLSGNNFGASRGSVTLIAGEFYLLPEPSVWRNDRIEFTVPITLEPLLGERGSQVTVWVKKPGSSLGPWTELRVLPDPAASRPEITRVSPNELRPGVIALIEGRGFGTSRGSVRFAVTSPATPGGALSFDGVIDAWSEALVAAHLPETMSGVGLGATTTVEVRNASGQADVSARVDVSPALDVEVLSASASCTCSDGGYGGGSRAVLVLDLANGWRTARFEEVHGTGWRVSSCGCQVNESDGNRYSVTPGCPRGGGDATCPCSVAVTIEGPRGIPWGTSRVETY